MPDAPYESVFLNSTRWPIRIVEGLNAASGTVGLARWVEQQIDLDADLIDDSKLKSLLHEIFHVALTDAGIRPNKHPEPILDALASAMVDVLRCNPWLVQAILKDTFAGA